MFSSNQLEELAQKNNWAAPIYTITKECVMQNTLFKAVVDVNGTTHKPNKHFTTQRAAENAAARAALDSMGEVEITGLGFSKNILQEHCQKSNMPTPIYKTEPFNKTTKDTPQLWMSTVEIGGSSFTGNPAGRKKEAEAIAANIAFFSF